MFQLYGEAFIKDEVGSGIHSLDEGDNFLNEISTLLDGSLLETVEVGALDETMIQGLSYAY